MFRITQFTTLILTVLVFTANARADNCDVKNLDFGSSQEHLKKQYSINEPDVAENGEESLVAAAVDICKEMPEKSILRFVLIDNKFVQLRIRNEETEGLLLKYANSVFGEMDNVEKDVKKLKKGRKTKLGLWSSNKDFNVVYTVYAAGRKNFENLVITSKNYKNLFDKVNEAKSKAADDYLRENHLGGYQSTYKETPSIPANDKLQIIKNNYDTPTNKERILKENENSRGYHYE